MLVGVAVGPFGFGRAAGMFPWIGAVTFGDPATIAPVAELGVAMLMFMIGLELSLERLWVMRRLVFGLGALQVAGSAAVLAALAAWAGRGGLALSGALVLGLAAAMSSTAVVLQVLSIERRLGTALGRICFAVLLFQDLAIVPVLVVLGLQGEAGAAGGHPFWLDAAKASGWRWWPSWRSAGWRCGRCSAASPAPAAPRCSSPPACWWCWPPAWPPRRRGCRWRWARWSAACCWRAPNSAARSK